MNTAQATQTTQQSIPGGGLAGCGLARQGRRLAVLLAAVLLGAQASYAENPIRSIVVESAPLIELSPQQVQITQLVPPQPASGLLQTAEAPVNVEVWVNRADKRYVPGESIQLFVRADQDASFIILNVDALGRTTVLLPNTHTTNSFFPANNVMHFPGPGVPYNLRVGEPYGPNLIKVIATTGSAGSFLSSQNIAPMLHISGGTNFIQIREDVPQVARSIQLVWDEEPQRANRWGVADLSFEVVRQR